MLRGIRQQHLSCGRLQRGYLCGLIDGTGIAVILIGLPLVLTGRWPLLGAISAALVVLVVLTWLWWLKVRLWGFGLWPRRGGRDA
mgnify:CR=1 FL=1